MTIAPPDAIPQLEYSGFKSTLESLAWEWLDDDAFVARCQAETGRPITLDGIRQFVADMQTAGNAVQIERPIGTAWTESGGITRHAKPTGIGQDGSAVWITDGAFDGTLRWYVNGEQKTETNEVSVSKAVLGNPSTDDVIQVAYIVDDVVGWWGRITV